MEKPLRVLMVEDSEDDALLVLRQLKKGGYDLIPERVETAESMLAALREKTWDVILCDYQMPQFNGLAAIALLKETGIDIPLIIVSGAIGEGKVVEAMKAGAHDCIMKNNLIRLVPAVTRELAEAESRTKRKLAEEAVIESVNYLNQIINRIGDPIFVKDQQLRFVLVNEALCAFLGKTQEELIGTTGFEYLPKEEMVVFGKQDRLVLETGEENINEENLTDGRGNIHTIITKKTRHIDGYGNKQIVGVIRDITELKQAERNLTQSFLQTRKTLEATVRAIASVVETRDPYTAGHQRRVADLARAIGTEVGLPNDQIEGLRLAGTIHDIGKVSVPAEILSLPRKLTDIEFSLIKAHPQAGYDILQDIEFPRPIAKMILEHHERMDGSGYPSGLTGDNLLIESKILSVADVVESMVSHRPYRPSLGIAAALEEIEKNRGTLYDNAVADACLKLFQEKGYHLLGE
jgi:PAS domain S-box-containing protein